ncbi:hypothetical protein [Pimelobacter simplex]|uniref:hypothetical protein n=1 Tax=Nocardioides simplex TaxID=2045 RepID=UPI003AACF4C0
MVLGGPERFSSGGRGVGVVGLVVAAVFVAVGLLREGDGRLPPWLLAAGALFGVLTWSVLVRPSVVLHPVHLELRNVLRDTAIPYGLIAAVRVEHMTVVEAGGRRYLGTGLGRARRSVRREGAGAGDGSAVDVLARFGSTFDASDRDHTSIGGLVQTKIQHRVWHAEGAVRELGAVRQRWAWPELTLLAVLALATVVLAFVG